MSKIKITFIQTGGTIDKDYPRGETHHGYEFAIGEPAVSEIIPRTHALYEYSVTQTLQKDSLDITDDDRLKIVQEIRTNNAEKIIITHGTDTILKTAEEIAKAAVEKTVVLTGSMLPNKFVNSDAGHNIGMAVAAVQILPNGVYIALYGRVVPIKDFPALVAEYDRNSR